MTYIISMAGEQTPYWNPKLDPVKHHRTIVIVNYDCILSYLANFLLCSIFKWQQSRKTSRPAVKTVFECVFRTWKSDQIILSKTEKHATLRELFHLFVLLANTLFIHFPFQPNIRSVLSLEAEWRGWTNGRCPVPPLMRELRGLPHMWIYGDL